MDLGYRDYLVDPAKLPGEVMTLRGEYWLHAYLENTDIKQKIVKIKKKKDQNSAWVVIKWRDEDPEETTLPYGDAMKLLERPFIPVIEKDILEFDPLWNVSFYHGDLEGLVMGTYRVLQAPSYNRSLTLLPPWVMKDITDDTYYRDWNLAKLMRQNFKIPENWWAF